MSWIEKLGRGGRRRELFHGGESKQKSARKGIGGSITGERRGAVVGKDAVLQQNIREKDTGWGG